LQPCRRQGQLISKPLQIFFRTFGLGDRCPRYSSAERIPNSTQREENGPAGCKDSPCQVSSNIATKVHIPKLMGESRGMERMGRPVGHPGHPPQQQQVTGKYLHIVKGEGEVARPWDPGISQSSNEKRNDPCGCSKHSLSIPNGGEKTWCGREIHRVGEI
jgi:hypothetical protein